MALFIATTPNLTSAFPIFFTEWQDEYPTSNSANNASCQLCHVNSGGGNGWNAYGWSIRNAYNANGNNLPGALRSVEGNDADNDPAGASNLTELLQSRQPGWTEGPNNSFFCRAGPGIVRCGGMTQLDNQLPSINASNDPAIPIQNPLPSIATGEVIALHSVANGFVAPNLAIPAPGIAGHLFVVDQIGEIWQVDLASGDKTLLLDLSAELIEVGQLFGANTFDERGLLGLAFHPDFASNGLMYTYQSEPVNGVADYSTIPNGAIAQHQSVIAQWIVNNPLDSSRTVGSKKVLLRIDQPQFNHDGGMLAFGDDGYLYISLGDGGNEDDQGTGHSIQGNSQDTGNPLGSILRINPLNTIASDSLSTNGQYYIPANNPFVGIANQLDEIYAYGLRNVFRFSFDRASGELRAADVGQNDIEEVNLIELGGNYGWNAKEGSFFFHANGNQRGYVSLEQSPDASEEMIDPVLEYDHDDGLSVIGGYVYRGNQVTALSGKYLFGDWSRDFTQPLGRLFYQDGNAIKELNVQGGLNLFVNGFGQDQDGELYVLGNTTGTPSGMSGVLLKIVNPSIEDDICFPIKLANAKATVICL